jgi:hypothetical protein
MVMVIGSAALLLFPLCCSVALPALLRCVQTGNCDSIRFDPMGAMERNEAEHRRETRLRRDGDSLQLPMYCHFTLELAISISIHIHGRRNP